MAETDENYGRLWDSDHPYYCEHGSAHFEWETWAGFLAEWGDSDPALNFLFRWDWRDDRDDEADEFLEVFFVSQRKGHIVSNRVRMDRSDEPAARKWLRGRAVALKAIWEPFDLSGLTVDEARLMLAQLVRDQDFDEMKLRTVLALLDRAVLGDEAGGPA